MSGKPKTLPIVFEQTRKWIEKYGDKQVQLARTILRMGLLTPAGLTRTFLSMDVYLRAIYGIVLRVTLMQVVVEKAGKGVCTLANDFFGTAYNAVYHRLEAKMETMTGRQYRQTPLNQVLTIEYGEMFKHFNQEEFEADVLPWVKKNSVERYEAYIAAREETDEHIRRIEMYDAISRIFTGFRLVSERPDAYKPTVPETLITLNEFVEGVSGSLLVAGKLMKGMLMAGLNFVQGVEYKFTIIDGKEYLLVGDDISCAGKDIFAIIGSSEVDLSCLDSINWSKTSNSSPACSSEKVKEEPTPTQNNSSQDTETSLESNPDDGDDPGVAHFFRYYKTPLDDNQKDRAFGTEEGKAYWKNIVSKKMQGNIAKYVEVGDGLKETIDKIVDKLNAQYPESQLPDREMRLLAAGRLTMMSQIVVDKTKHTILKK